MKIFKVLDEKKIYYNDNRDKLSKRLISDMDRDFVLKFTNDTVKIDGNSMTYYESKTILEDGYAIGGKSLQEHFELINSCKAFDFIRKYAGEFSENFIRDVYKILIGNISDDFISYRDMKFFISDFNNKKGEMHPIELACWVHAEFVRIHPFIGGNGRTARLLMNYILMSFEFLPISIKPSIVSEYYSSLDDFGCGGNLNNFVKLVSRLEEERLDEYINEIDATQKISKMDLV